MFLLWSAGRVKLAGLYERRVRLLPYVGFNGLVYIDIVDIISRRSVWILMVPRSGQVPVMTVE